MFLRTTILCVLIDLMFLAGSAFAGSPQEKEINKLIEARYPHNCKVKILLPKINVAPYNESGIRDVDYFVHYDHFYTGLALPKKYTQRDNFDNQTTVEVSYDAGGLFDELTVGETLQVVETRLFRRTGEYYALDFMLKSGPRRISGPYKYSFGVHFRFAFPPDIVDRSQIDTILNEVNHHFVPEAEYRELEITKARELEQVKNVRIEPGMSEKAVIGALGEPAKRIQFGQKTILKYPDLTIEFQDDKVIEVKAN